MRDRIFLTILALTLFNLAVAWPVQAVTTPSFPACSNPQGNLRVEYSTGTHGVPGNTNTYTGSDAVYNLTDSTLAQCLCLDTGQGIQTNWWKVSSLNQSEIDILVNSGWTFIPDGSLWGLDPEPYLTQNSDYTCGGTGGGDVLGASVGQVLGLAATGDNLTVYALVVVGLSSLFISLAVRQGSRR